MRTLFEIIESAKSGEMPSHEECYWAMLALEALGFFDHQALSNLANRPSKIRTPEFQWKESFRRYKIALDKDPKEYCGPSNDPSTPEYQKRRSISLKILDKVSKKLDIL